MSACRIAILIWMSFDELSRAFSKLPFDALDSTTYQHISWRQRNAELIFLFTCVRRSQQIYFDLVLICWLSDRLDIYGSIVREKRNVTRHRLIATVYWMLSATFVEIPLRSRQMFLSLLLPTTVDVVGGKSFEIHSTKLSIQWFIYFNYIKSQAMLNAQLLFGTCDSCAPPDWAVYFEIIHAK